MELNWTTFLLEMVNFLVLVWLLKRFFYRPVKRVIEERKASIEKSMKDAENLRREADELQSRYQNRLKDWEREKEAYRATFLEDLEKERRIGYAKFEKQLELERERMTIQETKKTEELAHHAERKAMRIAMRFGTILLKKLACPDMERRLVDLTIEQLSSPAANKLFRKADVESETVNEDAGILRAQILSAFPLDPEQKNGIVAALTSLIGREITPDCKTDSSLIAGVEIFVGAHVIQASLRNEMQFFARIEHA